MELNSSDLQDLDERVYWPGGESLTNPGWLLGKASDGKETELNVGDQKYLHDPKAEQMFDLYTQHSLRFAWEIWRCRLILLTWLIYTLLQKHVKRGLDLLITIPGLILVLPIMLFIAIAIKLESPGPAIFKQERVGKWGRRFICYKFRSMCQDAEARKAELLAKNEADEIVFKIKRDPRVTRVGCIIRKLSIDELPQVLNVIKGDMSLVGPRPPVPIELEYYPFDTFRRLDAVPGLTGLQQVSGRSDLPFKRWVELDIEYIRDQSLKKDIEILLRTIPTVISGKGAY